MTRPHVLHCHSPIFMHNHIQRHHTLNPQLSRRLRVYRRHPVNEFSWHNRSGFNGRKYLHLLAGETMQTEPTIHKIKVPD